MSPFDVPPGGVVGEGLIRPAVDGASEAGQLGDVGLGGVLEEHDQATLGVGQVVGGVDLREQLAGEPDSGDLTIDAPAARPARSLSQPFALRLRHVISSSSADAVERVAFSAAVACWMRRRTSLTASEARRMAWK